MWMIPQKHVLTNKLFGGVERKKNEIDMKNGK